MPADFMQVHAVSVPPLQAQISTIQSSVMAEAEENAARAAELSKATAAAGDAMIEQQQCKEAASKLKEENRQLRRELEAREAAADLWSSERSHLLIKHVQ